MRLFILFILCSIIINPYFKLDVGKYFIGKQNIHKIFYMDKSFDESEFILLQEACDEWEFGTNKGATFEVYYGIDIDSIKKYNENYESALIIKMSSEDKEIKDFDKLGVSDTLGIYKVNSFQRQLILVSDRMYNKMHYRATIIHEIGHSLGLPHIDNNEDAIMYPYMGWNYYITDNDIKLFNSAYLK